MKQRRVTIVVLRKEVDKARGGFNDGFWIPCAQSTLCCITFWIWKQETLATGVGSSIDSGYAMPSQPFVALPSGYRNNRLSPQGRKLPDHTAGSEWACYSHSLVLFLQLFSCSCCSCCFFSDIIYTSVPLHEVKYHEMASTKDLFFSDISYTSVPLRVVKYHEMASTKDLSGIVLTGQNILSFWRSRSPVPAASSYHCSTQGCRCQQVIILAQFLG